MQCGIAVHDRVTSSVVHDCFGSEEVDLLTEQLEVYILRYECNTQALYGHCLLRCTCRDQLQDVCALSCSCVWIILSVQLYCIGRV